MGQHVANLIAPLHRLDVPGERDEIAPIARPSPNMATAASTSPAANAASNLPRKAAIRALGAVSSIVSSRWIYPALAAGFVVTGNLRAFRGAGKPERRIIRRRVPGRQGKRRAPFFLSCRSCPSLSWPSTQRSRQRQFDYPRAAAMLENAPSFLQCRPGAQRMAAKRASWIAAISFGWVCSEA